MILIIIKIKCPYDNSCPFPRVLVAKTVKAIRYHFLRKTECSLCYCSKDKEDKTYLFKLHLFFKLVKIFYPQRFGKRTISGNDSNNV